jgi:hypothetical protein
LRSGLVRRPRVGIAVDLLTFIIITISPLLPLLHSRAAKWIRQVCIAHDILRLNL